jgi:hypothetical protein
VSVIDWSGCMRLQVTAKWKGWSCGGRVVGRSRSCTFEMFYSRSRVNLRQAGTSLRLSQQTNMIRQRTTSRPSAFQSNLILSYPNPFSAPAFIPKHSARRLGRQVSTQLIMRGTCSESGWHEATTPVQCSQQIPPTARITLGHTILNHFLFPPSRIREYKTHSIR